MQVEHLAKSQDRIGDTPFAEAIALLLPGASRRQELALFDGRVQLRRLRDWKLGERPVPSWALDKLKSELAIWKARAETAIALADRTPVKRKGNRATLKQFRQAA